MVVLERILLRAMLVVNGCKLTSVERSWDYLLKTNIGMGLAFACSMLVLIFIVAGGLVMRAEIHRQRIAREVKNVSENEAADQSNKDDLL